MARKVNTTQTAGKWTQEQIALGIAGCFHGAIISSENAVIAFVNSVIADKNAEIAAISAAYHAQAEELVAQLIAERAKVAELQALIAGKAE